MVFGGSVSGTGAVTQLGTGLTALTGPNTFSGGTTIAAGTLLGTAASFGSGPILDNAALIIDQPVSAVFANAINGVGSLLKRGLGALDLTGASGLSGPTTIAAGRLAVNGALAQSIVTVQNGAVLGGNGKVGGIIVQAGGVVAPGNSIGTLAVNGNFAAASGSLYLAELNATGQSDLIAATGTATIASGAQLQILKTDAAPFVPGTRYTLLTAAGGISGAYSFAAIQLSAFLGILPKYDATSLSLDIGKTSSFAAIGLTRNQIATGSGLDSLAPANPLSVAVAYLPSFAAGRAAFNQLAGEIHASAKTALVEGSHFVREAAIDRIRQAFDASAVGTQAIAVASSSPGPFTPPYAVWGRAYGSWGSTNSSANVARLDRSTGGFVLGADAALGDSWRIGIIGGYGATSFSLVNRAQSGHSDNFEGAIYGGGQWGNFGLRAGLAHAWHDINVNRSVAFAGFADHLSTSRRAATNQAFGEIGYRIDVSGAAFEPFASLAAVQLHSDGFSERGGAAVLRGRSTTQTTSFSTLGLRGSTSFALGDANLSARATLGWRHAFGRATPLQTASFAGGSAFTVAGTAIARDALTAETGLELQFGRDSLLAVTYSGQFARTARDQSLRGTFVQKF